MEPPANPGRFRQAAGRRFIHALKLFYHVSNIGNARSLAIQLAATTHLQLSQQDALAAEGRRASSGCGLVSNTRTISSPIFRRRSPARSNH